MWPRYSPQSKNGWVRTEKNRGVGKGGTNKRSKNMEWEGAVGCGHGTRKRIMGMMHMMVGHVEKKRMGQVWKIQNEMVFGYATVASIEEEGYWGPPVRPG